MDGSMVHDSGHDVGRKRRRGRPMAVCLATGLAAVALLASACGSSSDAKTNGVASVKSTNAGSTSQKQGSDGGGGNLSPEQLHAGLLAYSKCMRAHGISNFPDPSTDGGLQVDGNAVGQTTPAYAAADKACASLMPGHPPAGVPENRDAGLKYAACMRSHGVPKFPDPNQNGGMNIDGDKLGMAPDSPVFKSADDACKKYMGSGGNTKGLGGPGGPTG